MYAVKITMMSRWTKKMMTAYAGRRGEIDYDLSRIEGWKKKSSAENYVSQAVLEREDNSYGIVCYDVIEL